jgi:hypothetical protein
VVKLLDYTPHPHIMNGKIEMIVARSIQVMINCLMVDQYAKVDYHALVYSQNEKLASINVSSRPDLITVIAILTFPT